jgi:hypothetical protein
VCSYELEVKLRQIQSDGGDNDPALIFRKSIVGKRISQIHFSSIRAPFVFTTDKILT